MASLMGYTKRSNPDYKVILGPCPGCELWQLDYADEAMLQFGTYEAFCLVVEHVLEEHLAECPPLQLVVDAMFG